MEREIRGVMAKRSTSGGPVDGELVLVRDGDRYITLSLSTSSYPALLTVAEARIVARSLYRAARRLEADQQEKTNG